MSVSFALPGTPFAAIFSGARLAVADAFEARCGEDVVRLRPDWPAIIAATRFARRPRWQFGNHAATLECIEPQRKRWLSQRGCDDPVQVRFALDRWASAYARAKGMSRTIDVFAFDGTAIAAVELGDADAALDELIWLLVDDDQRAGVSERRRYTNLLRPFAAGALCSALVEALGEALPLEVCLENAGGTVRWTPSAACVIEQSGCLELRSWLGRVTMCDRRAGIWSVREDVIEARSADDVPWVQIGLAGGSAQQRLTWRSICGALS